MEPVPLFVELCAGLASVSGVLEHGSTWKPPVSRMGRKTGYAGAILRVMGLRPRQKAARYLWAEADGDVAALLAAYTQPDVMREIAEIIRSWIPCPYGPHAGWCVRCKGTGRWDARDLWEVLRREERRGLWPSAPSDLAAWLVVQARTFGQAVAFGPGGGTTYMEPAADGSRCGPTAETLAPRLYAAVLPWPPVLIAQDARVEPGEVAAGCYLRSKAYDQLKFERLGAVAGGYLGHTTTTASEDGRMERFDRSAMASMFASAGQVWPPVALSPSASIKPAEVPPPGTVVYIDPPYLNTTGYKHDLPRAEVVAIAERWHDAGARVYISEAEPIPIKGWHHVEITSERRGQARTFGATREFLTCSHPPAWTPVVQTSLFATAA